MDPATDRRKLTATQCLALDAIARHHAPRDPAPTSWDVPMRSVRNALRPALPKLAAAGLVMIDRDKKTVALRREGADAWREMNRAAVAERAAELEAIDLPDPGSPVDPPPAAPEWTPPDLRPAERDALNRLACYWARADRPAPVADWVRIEALDSREARTLRQLYKLGLIDRDSQPMGQSRARITGRGAEAWGKLWARALPDFDEAPEAESPDPSPAARLAAIRAAGDPFERVARARHRAYLQSVEAYRATRTPEGEALKLARKEADRTARREWAEAWRDYLAARGADR